MPSSPSLRAATDEDLAFHRQLYATTREDEMHAAGFSAEMLEAFIDMQFKAQSVHFQQHFPTARWTIIECDGVRAGRMMIHHADDHLRITDIALLPEFRGRSVGSTILEQILAEARERGLPVRLMALSGGRAMRLYHRLGFTEEHSDGLHTELIWCPKANTTASVPK